MTTTERVGPAPLIAVEHVGAGDTLIFLHGIGGSRLNWSDQFAAFGSAYQTLAWDLRGYGDSDGYDGPLKLDDICADLVRVLDHFGAERAHIVGLSMGGMIAMEFYRRSPERVRTLTLSNTNSGLAVDFDAEQRAEFVRLRKEPLLAGKTPMDLAPTQVKVLLSENASEAARQAIMGSIGLLRTEFYIKAIEAIVEFDSSDVLATISVPTLLIGSVDDRVTPIAAMRAMSTKVSGAVMVELAGGHLSNLEQPDAFNKAIREFLDTAA